ncbi:helix-turn-helix transcriptional regulator [Barrientosiimonas marina]|uniref:Helix-turn-helix domain-containing protein n=1 Tax=Lentibacillus kimchii TaxID=1542911 RepID=A0ABW2UQA7_9BACI
MKKIKCTLSNTLSELHITKNKLAVESKVRPNTITDIANNKAQAVNFDTLVKILAALEIIANDNNINRDFNVTDVFIYVDE